MKTLASEDGYVWLTEKTSLKNEWENWKGFVVLLSGLFVLVLLLFGVTVYVGRHPERVGEKWIYLFFKEGYVRYDFHKKDP